MQIIFNVIKIISFYFVPFIFYFTPTAFAWMPLHQHLRQGYRIVKTLPLGTGTIATFNYPDGVTLGPDGNIYVAEFGGGRIRKITPSGIVSTFVATGSFTGARSITYDSFSNNFFVTDADNHTIKKVTMAGVVSVFAGGSGVTGTTNGTGTAARFNYPTGIVADGSGNFYVVEQTNHSVRKITSAAVVTTFAGSPGSSGTDNSTGTGTSARFNSPVGITKDGSGNLFVTDTGNQTIRKIVIATQAVTTFAGTAGSAGAADGTGAAARFNSPNYIAADSSNNLYVTDYDNYTIRKITSAGAVTTFAGTAGTRGSANGTGVSALFDSPYGIVVDGSGTTYVNDEGNHTIRKITAAAVVTTLAGTVGVIGSSDSQSQFNNSYRGAVVDSLGNMFVTDSDRHMILKITPAGLQSAFAGTSGLSGSTNGTGAAARFNQPIGLAIDASDNIYVADVGNHTIRKITSSAVVTTLAGTAGSSGSTDATGAAARFNNPSGITADSSGNLYVADTGNHTIRKIVVATQVVTTLAGTAGSSGATDATGAGARFNNPTGISVDSLNSLYVSDENNHTLRKITSVGVVTTVAGIAGTSGLSIGRKLKNLSSPAGIFVWGTWLILLNNNALIEGPLQ